MPRSVFSSDFSISFTASFTFSAEISSEEASFAVSTGAVDAKRIAEIAAVSEKLFSEVIVFSL